MNIKVVCVGKLKEKYFEDGVAECVKRMRRLAEVKIVQVPDKRAPEKLSSAEMEQAKEIKGERTLDKIKDKGYVYVAVIKGKERTSEDFVKELANLTTYGYSDITFVIGGSLGISNATNKRADDLISFGKFAVPH